MNFWPENTGTKCIENDNEGEEKSTQNSEFQYI